MSRNNDVFQVLIPTSGTIAAADSTLASLALGQLGAFDYETNLAVDAPVSNFYFAVGVDNTGANTTKNDIVKSAGTHIQSKNIVSLTNQCYVAPVAKVIALSNWTAECDTEYAVKFEIRNQEALRLNGYNQVVKQYAVMSDDCVDCDTDCPNGDCFKVASDLMVAINEDPDAVITASALVSSSELEVDVAATTAGTITITIGSTVITAQVSTGTTAVNAGEIAAAINEEGTYFAVVTAGADNVLAIYGATDGTVVSFALGTALVIDVLTNPFAIIGTADLTGLSGKTACPTLVFTVKPAVFSSFCDINLNYFFPKQTDIILVAQGGFEGNSTVATTAEMVYEDGAGNDIKQLEYEAGGWNGKPGPYRVFNDGLAQTDFLYFTDATKKYNVIHLSYDQVSISGWKSDGHFVRTIIAVDDALNISDTIGAFVNTMTAGYVDAIVACVD